MKKLFTLFAVAMIAIGAYAQTLIAEKDFTGIAESELPLVSVYLEDVNASGSSDVDGFAINVESPKSQYSCPSVWALPWNSFELKENKCYKTVVTAKFPADGTLVMCLGFSCQSSTYVTATGDFQKVEVGFPVPPDPMDFSNMCLMFCCGDFSGTIILKKVQLYEMEDDAVEKIDDILYYFHKDSKTAEVARIEKANVVIPTTIPHDGEVYTVTRIMDQAFGGRKLSSVTIPNTVTEIGQYAFSGSLDLKEVTIPASVKVIGPGAFSLCNNLKRVTVLGETPPKAYDTSFKNNGQVSVDYNITLKVPDASMDIYKATAPWSNMFSDYEVLSKEKCEKPTVSVDNGKLNFSCATEGVEYHYEILASIKGDGNGVRLPEKFKISVYASKDGFYDSAVETSEIPVSVVADANGDGEVNAADIVKIVNIIMGK